MAEPQAEGPGCDAAEAARGEIEVLFALVRGRYGHRMTVEELATVREGIERIVTTAGALRVVRLRNSDEPLQPFVPFRAES